MGAGLGTALESASVCWPRGAMPKVQLPEEPERASLSIYLNLHITEISYREEDCVLKSVTSDWLDFLFFVLYNTYC